MKIGIIGTAAGHQVKVANTHQLEELAQKAHKLGASPATLQEVVQDVDVVFISIPTKAIAALSKNLFQETPANVVVADTGSYYPLWDAKIDALEQGQGKACGCRSSSAGHSSRPITICWPRHWLGEVPHPACPTALRWQLPAMTPAPKSS